MDHFSLVEWSFGLRVRDGSAAFAAAHGTLKAQRTHQFDATTRDHDVLTPELPAHRAGDLAVEVLFIKRGGSPAAVHDHAAAGGDCVRSASRALCS